MQRKGCSKTESIHASLLAKSSDFVAAPGFVATGQVRERWIANGCGQKIAYLVDFHAGKQGPNGTNIYIQTEKVQ